MSKRVDWAMVAVTLVLWLAVIRWPETMSLFVIFCLVSFTWCSISIWDQRRRQRWLESQLDHLERTLRGYTPPPEWVSEAPERRSM